MLCEFSCDPLLNKEGFCLRPCFSSCPNVCRVPIPDASFPPLLTPPPPSIIPDIFPPPSPPAVTIPSLPSPPFGSQAGNFSQKHLIMVSMVISSCLIGGVFVFCTIFSLLRRFYVRRNNPRWRNEQFFVAAPQNLFREDEEPVLEHPIWFINTIGLQQSVIDSITMFKYKKDEGLIQGTDCSVCLSEFREDDMLRLLPKCSHAFHVSCIDTWLRSHKNCPLCRAPIVSNTALAEAVVETSSDNSDSREGTELEVAEAVGDLGSNHVFESGTSEVGAGSNGVSALPCNNRRDSGNWSKSLPSHDSRSCNDRALSDLGGNQQPVVEEIQPIRRSVSLDSLSASLVYQGVGGASLHRGSSRAEVESSGLQNVGLGGNGNSSILRLVKSASIGRSLHRGHVSMKRASSSSRRFSFSRHNRGQSSILPL